MLSIEVFKKKYDENQLEESWKSTLSDSPLSDDAREKILSWIKEKWNHFLIIIENIEDSEELKQAVSNQYIEFKSHWFLLNTFIQYQTFLIGQPDEEVTYQASLLSNLINFFEGFMDGDEIDIINKMLANPFVEQLGQKAKLLEENAEAIAVRDSMEGQLQDLYQEKETMQNELGISNADQIISMVRSLEEQLTALYEERESASEPPISKTGNTGHGDHYQTTIDSLEEQLKGLYEEKEMLQREIGISDAQSISNMIQSMEEQLQDLYSDLEEAIVIEGKKITILNPRKIIIKKKP